MKFVSNFVIKSSELEIDFIFSSLNIFVTNFFFMVVLALLLHQVNSR